MPGRGLGGCSRGRLGSAGWRRSATNVALGAESAPKATFVSRARGGDVTNVAFGTFEVSKATFVTWGVGVWCRECGFHGGFGRESHIHGTYEVGMT
ncbi:hypothetical protein GCM10027199_38470 [Amycolatopsis magusensis]